MCLHEHAVFCAPSCCSRQITTGIRIPRALPAKAIPQPTGLNQTQSLPQNFVGERRMPTRLVPSQQTIPN
jgi:hypothetical protein